MISRKISSVMFAKSSDYKQRNPKLLIAQEPLKLALINCVLYVMSANYQVLLSTSLPLGTLMTNFGSFISMRPAEVLRLYGKT